MVFLTAATHEHRRILAHPSTHQILHGLWERSAHQNGWFVGNYVLMPDHVHLFARSVPEADSLASWLKAWKSISSRQLAASLGLVPPIWQTDYFDRYLRSDESYAQKWDYVFENPVRAGLVTSPAEWPYRGSIHSLE